MKKVKYNYDGAVETPIREQIIPGVILRQVMPDGSVSPFSDSLVVSVKDDVVKLARPYVVTDSAMGSMAWPWSSIEEYSASLDSVVQHFSIVLRTDGQPAIFDISRYKSSKFKR